MGLYKRKLFNRSPFNHYGSGIASGLSNNRPGFAAGGRVNFSNGGESSLDKNVAQSIAISSKDKLFDGREGSGEITAAGQINALSPIGKAYYIKLVGLLKQKGISREVFFDMEDAQRETIAESMNDQIIRELSSQYNVSTDRLFEEFGGDMTINDAVRGIETTLSRANNFNPARLDSLVSSATSGFDEQMIGLQEQYPDILDKLPEVAAKENLLAEEKLTQDNLNKKLALDNANKKQGLGGLDIAGDEFSEKYTDYLKKLEEDSGVDEKRRREAVQSSFINFGAADPIQEGESTMNAVFKAFQDPMAKLRAAETAQADDMYSRGADLVDKDLGPSDSREAQLAEYLKTQGASDQVVRDLFTGKTGQDTGRVEALLGNEEVTVAIQALMAESAAAGEALSFADAFQQITGSSLGSNITDQTIGNRVPEANGGRVGLQQGGNPLMEASMSQQPLAAPTVGETQAAPEEVQPMSFEELRMQLPDYISDDIVMLLSKNPEALMDLAEAQTAADLEMFEQKYNVQITMPLAEEEAIDDGAI